MGIKFEFFEAGQGDSILVTTTENKKEITNILIDGGAGNLYTRKLRNLKKSLDLVVLTHLDDDHILGLRDLLKFDVDNISKNSKYTPYIKEVWYNALINTSNDDIEFKAPNRATTISIKNQLKFREYVSFFDDKIQYRDYISIDEINQPLEINDIKLILLSPNDDKLKELYSKYRKELDSTTISTSSKCKDFDLTIEELYQKTFSDTDDSSVSNGSSIAFILIYKNKNFLFLADAHIPLIVDSLKKVKKQYFKNEKRIKFLIITDCVG